MCEFRKYANTHIPNAMSAAGAGRKRLRFAGASPGGRTFLVVQILTGNKWKKTKTKTAL